MAKRENKQQRIFEERKREYLHLFSREAKQVRDSIVKDIAAYNVLLSMEAESFDEIAFKEIAKRQNVPFVKDAPPKPSCPFCRKDDNVRKKEDTIFLCTACNRTFAVNYNSICSGTKCDALIWMKVLQCLLDYKGITKTCEFCGIAENTYYNIRNRLFYAMQILLDDVKLYGNIEVDHSFVRISYKGMDLRENDFPEDSIFFDSRPKYRSPRQRGGPYSFDEWNANNVCIFLAIDDRGHVLSRFNGIGKPTLTNLKNYVPAEKFSLEVPKEDPFDRFMRPQHGSVKTAPGDPSLMVADKEGAIRRFAQRLHIDFESHVYHRDGVQRKLSKEANDIQRANALGQRLRAFLRKCNYVSTKYLPGYLTFFEFIENTGASQAAIERLFQILATPNLGRPATFYQDMYSVPNYLLEWLDSEHPLKKFPYNKLLAFYLFDHIRHRDKYPDVLITMEYIHAETGYSAPTIRRSYRELEKAGYRDMILKHFGEPASPKIVADTKKKTKKLPPATFNPIVLAIYDEYAKMRTLPADQIKTLDSFLEEKNAQYGTNYKRTNILAKFNLIVEKGIRPPLPPLPKKSIYSQSKHVPAEALTMLEDYNNLTKQYREKGEALPKRYELHCIIADKYGVTHETVRNYLSAARSFLRNQKNSQQNHE